MSSHPPSPMLLVSPCASPSPAPASAAPNDSTAILSTSTPSYGTLDDRPQTPDQRPQLGQRRRHSFRAQQRRFSAELGSDVIFIKVCRRPLYANYQSLQTQVDLFLSELERRLDALEKYGNIKFDEGIQRAWSTLEAVRQASSNVSGELMDVGRRRAKVLVDVLESRYQDALSTRETLEGKASASLRLMEGLLTDFESRVHTVRAAAGRQSAVVFDRGWRRAEESLQTAREAVDDAREAARRAREVLRTSIERAMEQARAASNGLIRYEDLPTPWKANPHIHNGYRFCSTTYDCIISIFRFSNETFNIWSHALGLIMVLCVAFVVWPNLPHFSLATKSDAVVAALFFAAACKCLACSTAWHTMSSIADPVLMERWACVDYTGISLLVAASIATTQWSAFYCEPTSRFAYLAATTVFGIAGTILPWRRTFNAPDASAGRALFYIGLSATGFAPVLQLLLTRGPGWAWHFYAPIFYSIAAYLIGAVIYAARVPEKLLPGCFDYVGASHNIWHLAVLAGIVCHCFAMYEMHVGALQRAETECPGLLR